jgi:hypothetical protein
MSAFLQRSRNNVKKNLPLPKFSFKRQSRLLPMLLRACLSFHIPYYFLSPSSPMINGVTVSPEHSGGGGAWRLND